MGKIISVVNQKGGVGKTTSSVNLGAALAHLGKKVLIIDIDPQGNATTGIGVKREDIIYCVYDLIVKEVEIEKTIVKTSMKNLSIVPATIQLAAAEVELVSIVAREYKLKNAISSVKDEFDYIIIDCPPSLGLLTINSLTASDSVMIPVQCEYYALEGLTQLLNSVRLIQRHLNKGLSIEGVLLTMLDTRTNLGIEVAQEVKKYFKEKVYNTIIPRTVRLSEAPSFGMSIIQYDCKSKGAEVYINLAKEVISNNE